MHRKCISIKFLFHKFYNWIINHYAHTQSKSIQNWIQPGFLFNYCQSSYFTILNPPFFIFLQKIGVRGNCKSLMMIIIHEEKRRENQWSCSHWWCHQKHEYGTHESLGTTLSLSLSHGWSLHNNHNETPISNKTFVTE